MSENLNPDDAREEEFQDPTIRSLALQIKIEEDKDGTQQVVQMGLGIDEDFQMPTIIAALGLAADALRRSKLNSPEMDAARFIGTIFGKENVDAEIEARLDEKIREIKKAYMDRPCDDPECPNYGNDRHPNRDRHGHQPGAETDEEDQ